MLVAATGGHLTQLAAFAPRLQGYDDHAQWVTFDSPQSRSMLAGRRTHFIDEVPSRGVIPALRAVPAATRLLRQTRPSLVVSTGNAIAASFLPPAAALGIPAASIESAARTSGPSRTGKLLQWMPGVRCYCQYPGWPGWGWEYIGCVFDGYAPAPAAEPAEVRRVFVTLGTKRFGQRRLVERLLAIMPADVEVVWQTGTTDISGLGINPAERMPASEVERYVADCDVVVAHAGIGSVLTTLNAGKTPVVVPRLSAYGEHVDDHQLEIAEALSVRGLAISKDAASLTFADLVTAANRRVNRSPVTSLLPIGDLVGSGATHSRRPKRVRAG